jgi:ribonuclease HII
LGFLKAVSIKTQLIIGVDEAGRGPLAGPVMAAAVILDPLEPIHGLNDSKKLSEKRRDELAPIIRQRALAWSVASASVAEIDSINILQATFLAMRRALLSLRIPAQYQSASLHLQVDGNKLPHLNDLPFKCSAEAVVQGDALIPSISAASILAKVSRDQWMLKLHQQHPHYGFDQHKGYGTAMHLSTLRAHGACDEHRRSFAPIKALNKPMS